MFTQDDVEILRLIRRAKSLDLTLAEIADVLDLQRGGAVPCGRVTALLDSHIDRIDRTIADLHRLRRSLDRAHRTAREGQRLGKEAVICSVIENAG